MVYFIEAELVNRIKIGYAADLSSRRSGLNAQSPVQLTILATMEGDREVEVQLHFRFRHLRRHGEWFEKTSELAAFIADQATPYTGKQYRYTGGIDRYSLMMLDVDHSFQCEEFTEDD